MSCGETRLTGEEKTQPKNRRLFLGIDTSNYTTSAALADGEGNIVRQEKIPLPVGKGEGGLRQSDAVFAHVRALPEVIGRLRDELDGGTLAAVGCSSAPRDAEGSYMPCFLSGKAAAAAAAAAAGVPLFCFSHQAGHLAAARYGSGSEEKLDGKKYLALHVSGGTTDMMTVSEEGRIDPIGTSLDLHAGQAIDRVGLMLGLAFPCGPALEALAADVGCPRPKISVVGTDCNLSGVENICRRMLDGGSEPAAVAAYAIEPVKLTLGGMIEAAFEKYGPLPVLFAGGVMSNKRVRPYLSGLCAEGAYFAPAEFSSDNAAGIALLTAKKWKNQRR